MATAQSATKLLVIVGPTASGKSELAIKIAKQFNGEIISADSRTIHRGMDIGTAKPSKADQKAVRHWGIDLIDPGEVFSAAQFKRYATAAIADIQKRGKLPILAGGTGLYIDSVIFDFKFPSSNTSQRAELEKLSVEQLQAIIRQKKYHMPENFQNRRHLMATIERSGQAGDRLGNLKANALLVGLLPSDDVLRERINKRADAMFKSGVVEETRRLIDEFDEQSISTGGIIYRQIIKVIKNEITQAKAKDLFKIADWQYARRQRTWFKRNKFIQWFDNPEAAFTSVNQQLNNQIGA